MSAARSENVPHQSPDPRVLIAILDSYELQRYEDWNGLLQTTVSTIATFFGCTTNADTIQSILTKLRKSIEANNGFGEWIKLVYELREKAQLSQSIKSSYTLKKADSLMCITLNAMASYVVSELKLSHQAQFEDHKHRLRNGLVTIADDTTKDIDNRDGLSVTELNQALQRSTLLLAYLCDLHAINTVHGLYKLPELTYLPLPTTDSLKAQKIPATNRNFAAPLQFHSDWHNLAFSLHYQKILCVNWQTFISDDYLVKAALDRKARTSTEEPAAAAYGTAPTHSPRPGSSNNGT